MRSLQLAFLSFVLTFASQTVHAETYRIATTSEAAEKAVIEYANATAKRNPDIELIPGIAESSKLVDFLEQGSIDFALVPFESFPELMQSPLRAPFLAEDAAGIRQSIDSEAGAFAKANVERDTNLRVLDFWHVSSTILASRKPISTVADLQDLRVAATGSQTDVVLEALGAAQIAMAASEFFPTSEVLLALESDSLDSIPIPLDGREDTLNIALNSAKHLVDRPYTNKLYALVVTKDRWRTIPYPEKYALARAAVSTGEELSTSLDEQALAFKQKAIAKGVTFTPWSPEGVNKVRVASLAAAGDDATKRALVEVVHAAANAKQAPPSDDSSDFAFAAASRLAADVEILFATDRMAVAGGRPETAYSSSRELDYSDITYGRATIKLVKERELGDDLEEKTEIKTVDALNRDEFGEAISGSQQLVLFVHGYNNNYSNAVRRAAAIKADIAPDATVVSYTWPSEGEILSYGHDAQSAGISNQNFGFFIDLLIKHVSTDKINIISHSMGSRLVLSYVEDLAIRSIFPDKVKFQNLIFAASDVSQNLFEQKQLHPRVKNYPISAYADQITVYSSQNDRALGLSKILHSGDQPLGLLAKPATMFLAPGITAIDASAIAIDPAPWPFSFATRHSYVFDKAAGVHDISLLLAGQPVDERPGMCRKTRDADANHFWQLNPSECGHTPARP